MKSRYTTIDIIAVLKELQSSIGLRLNNVYDVDNKTYLFKMASKDKKAVLLMESGTRLHLTDFEWPKNNMPSGFSMKLRKHILNRRLEVAEQLGVDRIVNLQFGSNEAAYHVILELYDKGNIVLTDYQYNILNILRPRTDSEDVKFAVRNVYPVERAKQDTTSVSSSYLEEIISAAKPGDNLKRVLNPKLEFGPALIEHVLLKFGFTENVKIGKGFKVHQDISKLVSALEDADQIFTSIKNSEPKGYIIKKREKRPAENNEMSEFLVNDEFHPMLYKQHENAPYEEFPSFNKAVDDFFSKLEGQKIDLKAIQMEKEALKKLENVKKDHEKRILALEHSQEHDKQKAQLIEMNLEFVDKAIYVVQHAIASQINWKEISELLQEARFEGDPVAKAITELKLSINHITMLLSNPYDEDVEPLLIDIDLDLSAFANAKKYYDKKKHAATKEQKTIDSSAKAYKSAEKKTKQTLKEVATVTNIKKARKVHWFEKFFWFISSENYLVIGGRDQQQNELIVKKHLRSGDIYVHADLHGASSIVIKNPSKSAVPPKTLNEAGTMAVCYSSAWDAKVVTSAYWVYPDQVSKTAPTGEYLTTGSFMIRGKKNYLPPCHLIMGFGLLFKLGDESLVNHIDERKPRATEEEATINFDVSSTTMDDEEIAWDGDSEDENQPREKYSFDHPDQTKLVEKEYDSDNEDQTNAFPDTVVELEPVQGNQFAIRHRTVSNEEKAENDVVYLGDNVPVQLKTKVPSQRDKTSQRLNGSNDNIKQNKIPIVPEKDNQTNTEKTKSSKRGQKFRQKKMQDKYKDQDEDDRALALDLLKPAGPVKESKHKKRKKDKEQPKTRQVKPKQPFGKPTTLPSTHIYGESEGGDVLDINQEVPAKTEEADKDSDPEQERQLTQEDNMLLNSLTGLPLAEDILLYSIPMCAPYNCISNFKYKVKLTPGSGKRGKAVKTALAMFLHDKNGTPREKDLVKSLKDQDASRNIPGKVKMSAPQLMRVKNR
ncbi:hypothetical protein CHUAL_012242 [Chamberlinius hualienensis]